MRILILGHTGKIGSYIFNKLIETKHELISLGRSKSKCDIYYDFESNEGDLSGLEKLKIDLVINAIGKLPKHKANKAEYFNANINYIKTIKKYLNKEWEIIQLSTIAVYGEQIVDRAVKESDRVRPKNNYALTKLKAEKFITDNFKKYWIFRIPPVYKDFDDEIFYKRIIINRLLEINFNGDKQEHSYCSLDRIMEVIRLGCISSKLPYGIYNVADVQSFSVKKIKSHFKNHSLIKIPVSDKFFLVCRDVLRFLRIYSFSEKINEIYYKTCVSNLYCTKKLQKYIEYENQ